MSVPKATKRITPQRVRRHPYAKSAPRPVLVRVLKERNRAWAKFWVMAPCGGDGHLRETLPDIAIGFGFIEEGVEPLWGCKVPANFHTTTEAHVLAILVRTRGTAETREIAEEIGNSVSVGHVKDVRTKWKHELVSVLMDLEYAEWKESDVYDAMQRGEYPAEMIEDITQARLDRAGDFGIGQVAPEYRKTIAELWQEYRVAKSYQGYSPDDFELSPPKWFVVSELGIAPAGRGQA